MRYAIISKEKAVELGIKVNLYPTNGTDIIINENDLANSFVDGFSVDEKSLSYGIKLLTLSELKNIKNKEGNWI